MAEAARSGTPNYVPVLFSEQDPLISSTNTRPLCPLKTKTICVANSILLGVGTIFLGAGGIVLLATNIQSGNNYNNGFGLMIGGGVGMLASLCICTKIIHKRPDWNG